MTFMCYKGKTWRILCCCFFKAEDGIRDVAVTGVQFFFSSRRRHTRCSRDWSRRVLFRSRTLACRREGRQSLLTTCYLSSPNRIRTLEDLKFCALNQRLVAHFRIVEKVHDCEGTRARQDRKSVV